MSAVRFGPAGGAGAGQQKTTNEGVRGAEADEGTSGLGGVERARDRCGGDIKFRDSHIARLLFERMALWALSGEEYSRIFDMGF